MSKFVVEFPCKPYVKRFLELNYSSGSIIDFTKDKALYAKFKQKLEKPSFRHEKLFSTYEQKLYSEVVSFRISKDDFYRHGWELSKTDIVALNSMLESRCKNLMYVFVGTRVALGATINSGIDQFQEKFMFFEDVWKKDSILKDCQRNLNIDKNEISNFISEMMDKITLETLSKKKTILHKTKNVYEDNQI